MKTYIYPENLKANVKLWFWNVRDFIIICGGIILSVVVLVNLSCLLRRPPVLRFSRFGSTKPQLWTISSML